MIGVGVAATFVIVLSHALPEVSGSNPEKAKTEQTDQSTDIKVIAAPSDVVLGGIIQLQDADRFLIETLLIEKVETLEFQKLAYIFSDYFHVLFRAIISPNAP